MWSLWGWFGDIGRVFLSVEGENVAYIVLAACTYAWKLSVRGEVFPLAPALDTPFYRHKKSNTTDVLRLPETVSRSAEKFLSEQARHAYHHIFSFRIPGYKSELFFGLYVQNLYLPRANTDFGQEEKSFPRSF